MGEENFINILNKEQPDLVIFNNQSTKDYYFEYICSSYAFNFCNTVKKDYKEINYIKGGTSYMIFQRKK